MYIKQLKGSIFYEIAITKNDIYLFYQIATMLKQNNKLCMQHIWTKAITLFDDVF